MVALGGDGTLFEVVNGLCRQERELRPPVGLIPAGTGNAFAQELGLSVDDWKKSVALIQAGHTRPVDVGRVKTTDELFYFVNIIGMGFVTAAGQASKAFKFMGSAAYTLGTLRAMLGLKSYNLCLEVDGQPLELPNIFIEISNTPTPALPSLSPPKRDSMTACWISPCWAQFPDIVCYGCSQPFIAVSTCTTARSLHCRPSALC